jgi:hypothetical protein
LLPLLLSALSLLLSALSLLLSALSLLHSRPSEAELLVLARPVAARRISTKALFSFRATTKRASLLRMSTELFKPFDAAVFELPYGGWTLASLRKRLSFSILMGVASVKISAFSDKTRTAASQ